MNMHSWQALTTSKVLRVFFTIVLVAFWTACADDSQNLKGPDADAASGKKITIMDTPTITCGSYVAQEALSVTVTAGPNTGAPAGFSLQWMTEAEYIANGNQWYTSDVVCKASFSGNANGFNYSLAKGQSITVRLGDSSQDFAGASLSCTGDFVCGTRYVIHAFAHATSTFTRSAFTANLTCSTLACGENCTYTQGYWKTHGPVDCNPSGGSNIWPVTSLTLGSVSYTDAQLCQILNTPPVGGNSALILAHQLIAAKLNVANGATSITAIADADALIGSTDILTASFQNGNWNAVALIIDNYNNGADVVPHCQ